MSTLVGFGVTSELLPTLATPTDARPHSVEQRHSRVVSELLTRTGDVARDRVPELSEHVDRLAVATARLEHTVDAFRDCRDGRRDARHASRHRQVLEHEGAPDGLENGAQR